MARCTTTFADATPCGAPAMAGSDFYYYHDPEIAERRTEASARGGRAPRRTGIAFEDAKPQLDTPEKIATVVESYVGGLATGKATAAQVKVVTDAARILLAALDAGAVRREIDALKEAVKRIESGGFRVES